MKLTEMRIQNFRSIDDYKIYLDNYTCFVGPNGAGKSNVLVALNIFFRNSSTMVTNVNTLSDEDFHHRQTTKPVVITLTFEDLSAEAQKDFKEYFRQGKLIVSSKAEWNEVIKGAEVRQYGNRLVMEEFGEYFKALGDGELVADLREKYNKIKADFPELEDISTKDGMTDALHIYEEKNLQLCKLIESEDQFYGFSKGKNLLSKYIQWIHIPAVKDASSEQEEGGKTALKLLLDRTIRSSISFEEPISELKDELEGRYKSILENEREKLSELETSIEKRLQEWANPATRLNLDWSYDPNKSLVISNPIAKFAIGEGEFMGEVTRIGHGLQRGFLVSLLQELAQHSDGVIPKLLLGFEEPELYQHPPQAQHLSDLLVRL